MEQLSGYAPDLSPDLNPDEGIWQYLKNGDLKNVDLKDVYCEQIGALKRQRRLVVERLRRKTEVLRKAST